MKIFSAFLISTHYILTIYSYKFGNYLVTDFSQQTCIQKASNGITYYYSTNSITMLPYCEKYNEKGHDGDPGPCPPGYIMNKICKGTTTTCRSNADCDGKRHPCIEVCSSTTEPLCMAYHANTFEYRSTFYSAQKFKPKCTNTGDWEPKQCKGGITGKCFCYDATGKRLFGQAKYSESKNMTCACSRKKADLLASGRYYVSFHCDSKGNFEELQCNNGLCWCVEPPTGALTSPIVPEKAMIKLPCYKVVDVGGQYLRKCDSIAYAYANIEDTLKRHGVLYANTPNIQCDGDGAYGKYNLSGSIARCTWRDGIQIGSWQSDASTGVSNLNCNCARDYKLYQHQLTCEGSGNYLPLQTIVNTKGSQFFCVDTDGYPKTNLFNSAVENCTSYF